MKKLLLLFCLFNVCTSALQASARGTVLSQLLRLQTQLKRLPTDEQQMKQRHDQERLRDAIQLQQLQEKINRGEATLEEGVSLLAEADQRKKNREDELAAFFARKAALDSQLESLQAQVQSNGKDLQVMFPGTGVAMDESKTVWAAAGKSERIWTTGLATCTAVVFAAQRSDGLNIVNMGHFGSGFDVDNVCTKLLKIKRKKGIRAAKLLFLSLDETEGTPLDVDQFQEILELDDDDVIQRTYRERGVATVKRQMKKADLTVFLKSNGSITYRWFPDAHREEHVLMSALDSAAAGSDAAAEGVSRGGAASVTVKEAQEEVLGSSFQNKKKKKSKKRKTRKKKK